MKLIFGNLDAKWTAKELENSKNYDILKKYRNYMELSKKAKADYLNTLKKIKKLDGNLKKDAEKLALIEKNDCWEYYNKAQKLISQLK